MDAQPAADGSLHFRLGPIERWIVGTGAILLLGMSGYVGSEFKARMDEQGKQIQTVVTQQAVTNEQLQQLSRQLADVPGIVHDVSKLEVRMDEHERRIHELEQVKKLR